MVTLVIAGRAASRVRMTAGRVLSRRAKQISRMCLCFEPEVIDGPLDQRIEIVGGAVPAEDVGVVLSQEPPHFTFHRRGDEGCTARGST
ncbi:hypothetical protein BH23ACT6_BH23ACT6_25170 [soil metagenome]